MIINNTPPLGDTGGVGVHSDWFSPLIRSVPPLLLRLARSTGSLACQCFLRTLWRSNLIDRKKNWSIVDHYIDCYIELILLDPFLTCLFFTN